MSSHIPVLVDQFLEFFSVINIRNFVDGTVGAGGHSLALLKNHPEIERLYGIDKDLNALKIAQQTLEPFIDRVTLIHANFKNLAELDLPKADGIFLDLGISSMQVDNPERGFSVYKEGPLDMRMNQEEEFSAATVVNTFPEQELVRIFRDYGEEPKAKLVAKVIVQERKKKYISTTTDLQNILKSVLTWKGGRKKKIHPMTLIFQALRICVNNELVDLEDMIINGFSLLNPGGRFGIISFHSLEDRIVKNSFKNLEEGKILTKKPIIADIKEKKENRRSRSAKMRFIEKIIF